MDKRNPSSFAQLEKLGEGTYATVRTYLSYTGYQEAPIILERL